MKLISIIVPVYNVDKLLSKCIKSIIEQTYKNLEIILVDDGSQDKSGIICDQYALKDERIRVIHQINQGSSCARNSGLNAANGYYVGFVDSDDYIDKKMFQILVNGIEKDKSDAAMCGWHNVYPNKKISYCNSGKQEILYGEKKFESVILNNQFLGFACNKLFKLNIIKKFNIKFNEEIRIMEDLLFSVEYVHYCSKVTSIAKALYYYVQRNGSLIRQNMWIEGNYQREIVREEVIKILKFHNFFSIIIEEKAYKCEDAVTGICIAINCKNEQAKIHFTKIFNENLFYVKKSVTLVKSEKIKCYLMNINKKLCLILWKFNAWIKRIK